MFILLYGMRFDLEDHLLFIRVGFEAMYQDNVESPVVATFASVREENRIPESCSTLWSLFSYFKVLTKLMKKEYLIERSDLVVDWRRLYELFQFWLSSGPARRSTLVTHSGFENTVYRLVWVRQENKSINF